VPKNLSYAIYPRKCSRNEVGVHVNIIITPIQPTGPKEIFAYTKMIQNAIAKVKEKYPTAPKMAVCVDDIICIHQYEFTGDMTPGTKWAIAQCRKCNHQITIKPRIVNAENIETTNPS